ncbi:sulfite exporter TauE/SafE family protein [Rubrobacter marinus]|uniref:sulfite exporter TauE/SafE family protein n=1 Tax=Rubrobacter marinus TaxID=2653852 RepID=UPI0014080118|nr:sulfite exporter TauE/SafE family protein [Rubrobacter marinus]
MLSGALIVALLVALLAGSVSGLTGFGLALIAVPLLLFVYEPATVVVLVFVLSVFINVAVVWDSWHDADRKLVLALLPPAAVGVFVGAEVLYYADPLYIRLGVGMIVVFSALLLLREVRIPRAEGWLGTVIAGSTSGMLSTSTGLAGPPIVLLFAARHLPKHAFRGSSALYFLAMSVVGLAALANRGLLDWARLPLALALVPAAFLGKVLGTALLNEVSDKTFRVVTLGVVILTGTLGAATAGWALL